MERGGEGSTVNGRCAWHYAARTAGTRNHRRVSMSGGTEGYRGRCESHDNNELSGYNSRGPPRAVD